MNIKLKAWSILFVLMMSACSKNTAQAPQSVEQPPTPYPDTPLPARIDAPRVEVPEIIDLFGLSFDLLENRSKKLYATLKRYAQRDVVLL